MKQGMEQEKEILQNINDIEAKIENNIWIKNSTKIIAILTFICTIAVFLVRGFWYLYQWGYFKAIGVDRMYIKVEGMGILYYVLGYLGIATIIFASNCATYILWTKGSKWHIFVLLLIELFCFWGIIILTSYVGFEDIFNEIVKLGLGIEYLKLTIRMWLILVALNLSGIYFGVTKNIQRKKVDVGVGVVFTSIKVIIVEVLMIIVVEGVVTFCIGMTAGYEKKDYKLIVDKVENKEDIEERYLFDWNDETVRIYPVLLENEDIFVISYLCVGTDGIYIEKNHQKTIANKDIDTIYCVNIYEIINDVSDNQIGDKEEGEEKKEEENKMTDTLVGAITGAIIGALFTGICTYFIEEIKRKKSKAMQESHAAAMLYFDLKSIEDYLKNERSSVNIRYTACWQEMVSNCNFLKEDQIKYLYRIYDEVYNYNYHYSLKEKAGLAVRKEDIEQYLILQEIFELREVTDDSRKEEVKKYGAISRELEEYKKR